MKGKETLNNSIQFKTENYATENAGIWATNLQINPYGSLGSWLYEIQTAITSALQVQMKLMVVKLKAAHFRNT